MMQETDEHVVIENGVLKNGRISGQLIAAPMRSNSSSLSERSIFNPRLAVTQYPLAAGGQVREIGRRLLAQDTPS